MEFRLRPLAVLSFAAPLIAAVTVAHAGAPANSAGVLDQALDQYRQAAQSWQNAAQSAASTLFWSLATISLVWTMGQMVLRRCELGEFFGELARFLLFTGFWAWMLNNGPSHAGLILDSMVRLAGKASGQSVLSPSSILDVGFQVVDRALERSSFLSSPIISALSIVVALVILVALALVGVNMLVTVVACWVVAYGGIFVLGFGGSRWTSDMAMNYYRMVLSLALQVMGMLLLVGVGANFLRGYYDAIDKDLSFHGLAVILVISIVLLATVNRIPGMLGTLAHGSSPQHALGGGAGLGSAISTASTAFGIASGTVAAAKLATGTGFSVAKGAGKLAVAAGGGAVAGAAALGALLDGFRSRDGGGSAASGAGSVFDPSPASGQGAWWRSPPSEQSSSQAPGGQSAPAGPAEAAPQEADETGSADDAANASNADEADSADQTEPMAPGVTDPQPDLQGGPAADARDDASTGQDAPQNASASPSGAGGDYDAPTPASNVSLASEVSSAPAAAPTPGQGGNSNAASSTTDPPSAGATSGSPGERTVAASGPGASSTASSGAPTGTFAGPAATGSSAPSTAAAAAGAAPVPTTVTTGATSRAAVAAQDLSFADATTGGSAQAKPAAPPAPPPLPERAEMPAAYSTQLPVDIEAEVAAFRDRD